MYTYQQTSSGQTLTASFVNQTITNVYEHKHGQSSVSNVIGGIFTSVTSFISLDTQEYLNASGTKLLSVQNKDEEKFAVGFDGEFSNRTLITMNNSAGLSVASGVVNYTPVTFSTTSLDLLGEATSTGFIPKYDGVYLTHVRVDFSPVNSDYGARLCFYVNSVQWDFPVTKVIPASYVNTAQRKMIVSMVKSDKLTIGANHSAFASVQITNIEMFVFKLP